MAQLKLGLDRLTPGRLLDKCVFIEQQIDGNPYFPSPRPAHADLSAKRQELADAIAKASTGEKTAISIRDDVFQELADMLRTLSKYVSMEAEGRESVILSSGFEVRNTSKGPGWVTSPTGFEAKRTERQGELKLTWNKVQYAKSYIAEITTTDPSLPDTLWTKFVFPTRRSIMAEDLTPGVYYYFRVCAVGSRNTSGYSDVAIIMA